MKKKKITEETQNPAPAVETGKPKKRRGKIFLTLTDPLLTWIEARAGKREDDTLQPAIKEKLLKQYEREQESI